MEISHMKISIRWRWRTVSIDGRNRQTSWKTWEKKINKNKSNQQSYFGSISVDMIQHLKLQRW